MDRRLNSERAIPIFGIGTGRCYIFTAKINTNYDGQRPGKNHDVYDANYAYGYYGRIAQRIGALYLRQQRVDHWSAAGYQQASSSTDLRNLAYTFIQYGHFIK